MRRRIIYSGRVQGVGFRATARSCAEGLAVTGWVRNGPDRTVLLEVQGSPHEVERFCGSLASAMGARISAGDMSEVPDQPGESGFEIRF